jgi:hypothetical protein
MAMTKFGGATAGGIAETDGVNAFIERNTLINGKINANGDYASASTSVSASSGLNYTIAYHGTDPLPPIATVDLDIHFATAHFDSVNSFQGGIQDTAQTHIQIVGPNDIGTPNLTFAGNVLHSGSEGNDNGSSSNGIFVDGGLSASSPITNNIGKQIGAISGPANDTMVLFTGLKVGDLTSFSASFTLQAGGGTDVAYGVPLLGSFSGGIGASIMWDVSIANVTFGNPGDYDVIVAGGPVHGNSTVSPPYARELIRSVPEPDALALAGWAIGLGVAAQGISRSRRLCGRVPGNI